MTVIIKDDDEFERTLTDVIAYDVLCEEDIDVVESALDIKLTEEQRKEVARRCRNAEYFPSMDDLRWIVRDVYEGR